MQEAKIKYSTGDISRLSALDEGRANSKEFVHLHVHTEYSMLDGATRIKDIVKKAKDQGSRAVAITDHGCMYGVIKFYKECMAYPVFGRNKDDIKPEDVSEEEFNARFKDKICPYKEKCPKADNCREGKACKVPKVKPLIGCEFYVTEDIYYKQGKQGARDNPFYHLILIAKNMTGYKNLIKLNSIAFLEGKYYKPRIDLNLLSKYSEGLICTSACLAGAVTTFLLEDNYNMAKDYAIGLQKLFGKDDFYIEIQDHNLQEQRRANPLLIKLAREIGASIIATNDVHYLKKEHSEMHDVLLCIQTGAKLTDEKRMRFTGEEFYFKSYDEMAEKFGFIEEALENTVKIADKCDLEFKFNEYQIPPFKTPNGQSPENYLRALTKEGLIKRYKDVPIDYHERANMELEVIINMGFAEYYLIVWDFIYFAKCNDIPVGPGRGSGVGSIVAYALEITDVDPMKYDLIFERFLNADRISMPDFDIDFCTDRRGEVIKYVRDKYGEDKTSQIITFGRLQKKQAIKDVARVYDVPFSDVTKLTSLIEDNNPSIKIKDLINYENKNSIEKLIELYETDELYKKILDISSEVEGLTRHSGVHAAGVVIYKETASDIMPLALNGDEITTQYDMSEVEELGLLKMDFLGLRTLTDIKKASDYVKNSTGKVIDFNQIGYSDKEVFEMISRGETDAVFQLEGGGMKKFMVELKPNNIEDIIAGISLYRPGPMDNIPLFKQNKKNPEKINYGHESLEPILNVTYGVMVYQEQAMKIAQVLGGYDMKAADNLRRIIGKKKLDDMEKEKPVFISNAVSRGISESFADKIFEDMKKFGSYAFNKSHAAAYAYVGYQTAYLKNYYPVEFMTAVINNRISNPDDTKKYMALLKALDIELLPPDINNSFVEFSPERKTIRYGLSCIKGVGAGSMEKVIEERAKNGRFNNFVEFIQRTSDIGLNKKMIQSLILGGAFDCFNLTRATLINNFEKIMEREESERKMRESDQMSFFDFITPDSSDDYKYMLIKEYSRKDKLAKEKEVLGMYLSGHPLAGLEKEFDSFNFNTNMLLDLKKKTEEKNENEEDELTEAVTPVFDFKSTIKFGGLLNDVRITKTKKGKAMAMAKLEDMYDRIDILIFGRQVEDARDILVNDKLVKIEGNIKLDEENGASIFVSKINEWTINDKEDNKVYDKRMLYIKINDPDDKKMFKDIEDILSAHSGTCAVRYVINSKTYQSKHKVDDIVLVKNEIICLLGSDCVKIV